MKSWFAVYVRSKQEQKVYNGLVDSGIHAFLPLIKVVKFYSDRKKTKFEVLFKSYVFVYITLGEMLAVMQTDGVVGFVKFEGKAVVIPEAQILAVQKFIEGEDLNLSDADSFLQGQKVEVIKGPFKGQVGRLSMVDKKEVVILELEALNTYIPLKIRKSFLKKIV